MNEPQIDVLTQRLDRLERQNRWWKILGVSAMAILGLAVFVGATGSKEKIQAQTVEARNFVLRDADGQAVGTLGLEKEHGWPVLALTNANGETGVVLSATDAEHGSFLRLSDEEGRDRVVLSVPNSIGLILLKDEENKPQAVLGERLLSLYDENGTQRMKIETAGNPVLRLMDEASETRVLLDSSFDGSPAIRFFDNGGKTRLVLGRARFATDVGGLSVLPVSSMVLLNEDERPIWQAP